MAKNRCLILTNVDTQESFKRFSDETHTHYTGSACQWCKLNPKEDMHARQRRNWFKKFFVLPGYKKHHMATDTLKKSFNDILIFGRHK